MNYSEVKELLAAGFTHDEIMSFAQNPQNNPQPVSAAESGTPADADTEPSSESSSDPAAADSAPAAAPDPEDDKFNALNETMQKLIKTIQTSNLRNNSYDKSEAVDIDKQVDSIMATLIRPEHDKKGEK